MAWRSVFAFGRSYPVRGVTPVRRLSSITRKEGRMVLGCGSNVVDSFYMVKALPRPGEKGFFLDPTKVLEAEYVGGVTLNHLSWAQLLGTPTGLLALQGEDHHGRLIRQELNKMGVETKFIEVKDSYTTSQSLVFVEEGGERSIIMAKGATSQINTQQVALSFGDAIANSASLVSTEISQVPLSGVLELLRLARESGVPSVVDLDVSPHVAVNEALLGSEEEFVEVCRSADVLKPARHAAEGAIRIIAPHLTEADVQKMPTMELARLLQESCGSKLVAMTDGLAPSCFVTQTMSVSVTPTKLDKVVDATGAGDAFLGGLISVMHRLNAIPSTEDELRQCGQVANRLGSACCEVLGAVPTPASRDRVKDLAAAKTTPSDETSTATASRNAGPSALDNSLLSDIASLVQLNANPTLSSQLSTLTDRILAHNKGNIIISGVGKSGIIARRMAATLSSISVPAEFVHAAELHHGDFGKIRESSLVILLSHSGNSSETVASCELAMARGAAVAAITSNEESSLAKMVGSANAVSYGPLPTVEPAGGVPTSSLVVQEAVINGLANNIIDRTDFDAIKFGSNHPGGALGASLPKF